MLQLSIYLTLITSSVAAFQPHPCVTFHAPTRNSIRSSFSFHMVGGKGYDSNSYLDNLSGEMDEEKREELQQQTYSDFRREKERWDDMRLKQAEFMKTERGQSFMKAREQAQRGGEFGDDMDMGMGMGMEDPSTFVGSGGGSKLKQMMHRAKQNQRMNGQNDMIGNDMMYGLVKDDDDDMDSF